ncbi:MULTISPECIES: DUF4336 domain-containing protein [unclassified Haladaptatus]|uniref:DUF4336 domain-containing protein n=1 Tax=unclassified Haladaptatus TaxID=2622732 RepID=UPI00209C040A|nr:MULTISPECIES: DUF4336 domain-containing protein [unclassified Haladaptatus]MCO8245405.1 DUF4336 domain-containing protein [Haladaptatus sp. AB643]MCO8256838.1 DUF4336 domain-containing protein [Haladaptatus sp. AB618]
MFTELASNIFVLSEPLSFYGLQIGRNMVVIRLPNGDLFINSPASLTDDRISTLKDFGRVRYVAPSSKLHGHLHMEDYKHEFPDAELFAAPGLDRRRTDLVFDGLLGSTPDERWSDVIDQAAFLGSFWITEIEFFHRPSKTLIIGDICYNLGPKTPLKTRLATQLLGMYGDLSVPLDLQHMMKNKAAARHSIDRILEWDFERVIVGHGNVVEHNPKRRFREAFDWLY